MANKANSEANQVKDEAKLTPLQRVQQQKARMQQTRNAGTSRKLNSDDDTPGASEGGTKRIDLQRRSGGG